MPEQLSRQQIFALAAAKMRQDFAGLRVLPHKGVKGSEAEGILRRFLNDHLPQRFRATSGFVIDRGDAVTGQTDIIIYDALNCPLYRVSDDAGIVPNDNVAAVVEVKSRLTKEAMQDAADKIRTAKNLTKTGPYRIDLAYNTYENYETIGILFAFDSDISAGAALEHYRRLTLEAPMPHHIDYVFVLDSFVLQTMMYTAGKWMPAVMYAIPPVEGLHLAVSAIKTQETTVDAFIRYVLAHLAMFRHRVDHPGFDWKLPEEGEKAMVSYLTSVTFELQPDKREFKLAVYREQAREIIMGQ